MNTTTATLEPQIGYLSSSTFDRSPELGELATALSAAQGEFEAVGKSAANPFFKSKYAPLPEVVKAASPILASNGLAVSQLPGHDSEGDTLTTILMHKSGQYIADTMRLRTMADKSGELTPQAQGSAMTYARRYSYMAILGLVADEDDDGNAGSAGTRKPAKAKPTQKPKGQREPIIDFEKADELKTLAKDADKAKVKAALEAAGVQPKSSLAATIALFTPDEAAKFEASLTGAPLLPENGAPLNG